MSWLSEHSVFTFGKYKGKEVRHVKDAEYIKWVHESHLDVFFTEEVFKRLGIKHNGLSKEVKGTPYKGSQASNVSMSRVMKKLDKDDARWMKQRKKKAAKKKK